MRLKSFATLLVFGLFASQAFSKETSTVELKIDDLSFYRENACPQDKPIEGLQAAEVLSIDEFFASEGLLGTNPAFGEGQLIFDVDEIYASDNLSRLVLTKFCLEPLAISDIGKIIEMGEGEFLFHGKTGAGLPFAMYFIGHKRSGVEAVTSALKSALDKATATQAAGSAGAKASGWTPPSLMESAWARHGQSRSLEILRMRRLRERRQDPGAAVTHPEEGDAKVPDAETPPEPRKNTLRDTFRNVAHCMKGITKGVYRGSIGVVVGVARSVFRFAKTAIFAATHPKLGWRHASARTKEASTLLRKFEESEAFNQGSGGFKSMPMALKAEFICQLVATIGTGAAMSMLIMPSISSQAETLWQVLKRHKSLEKFVKYFFDRPPPASKTPHVAVPPEK